MTQKQPTLKQLEAYYWTHIVGLNNIEAGERMSVSGQTIGEHLQKIYKLRPELDPNNQVVPKKSNTVSLGKIDTCDITRKF